MAKSIINANGMSWQLPSRGVTMLGSMQKYDTFEELQYDSDRPEFAWVADATGDPTVAAGGAFYFCGNGRLQRMFSEFTTAANVDISTIKEVMSGKANKFVNVFVRDEQELTLEDETKYYIMNKLIATLPDHPENGTTIQIVVLPGGEASVLKSPEGVTVNGQSGDLALNSSVFEATLVFDTSNNGWYLF